MGGCDLTRVTVDHRASEAAAGRRSVYTEGTRWPAAAFHMNGHNRTERSASAGRRYMDDTNNEEITMNRITLGLSSSLCAAVLSACASVSLQPIIGPFYPAPCKPDPDPVFQLTVSRNAGIGNIRDGRAWLIINGEEIAMQQPSSGTLGTYQYVGTIPYDGEARYRFSFYYTLGYGVFRTNQTALEPTDRYLVASVGHLTWSSPNRESTPLPNAIVNQPGGADLPPQPRRLLRLGERGLSPGTTGLRTDSGILTLRNGESYPLTVSQPTIVDRATGATVTDVTVQQSSGSTIYPITVGAGATVDFYVAYRATLDGTADVRRHAGIRVPYTDTIRNCSLGPIWVDASFSYNPP